MIRPNRLGYYIDCGHCASLAMKIARISGVVTLFSLSRNGRRNGPNHPPARRAARSEQVAVHEVITLEDGARRLRLGNGWVREKRLSAPPRNETPPPMHTATWHAVLWPTTRVERGK